MHKNDNSARRALRRGFTLIELLIVVAILGILGAIGVPMLTEHLENSKITAAETAVRAIDDAIVTYLTTHSKLPADLKVLVEERGDKAPVLKGGEGVLIDPWDNEYKLEAKSKNKFKVVSAGPDGQFGTDDDIASDKVNKKKDKD